MENEETKVEIDLGSEPETKAEETQTTEETSGEETSWEKMKSLEKFGGDPNKMAKSYLELEKKLSSQNVDLTKLSDEELVEYNKKAFEPIAGVKSSLEGSFAEVSNEIAESLGLPTKLVDSAVAKTAKEISVAMKTQNVNKAKEFLSDAEKKAAVTAHVKSVGGDYAKVFNERLSSGNVGPEELQLLASGGATITDSDLGLDANKVDSVNRNELEKELISLSRGANHSIIKNPNHPDNYRLTQRQSQLRKILYGG